MEKLLKADALHQKGVVHIEAAAQHGFGVALTLGKDHIGLRNGGFCLLPQSGNPGAGDAGATADGVSVGAGVGVVSPATAPSS